MYMHFLLRRSHHQRQQWRTLFDDALSLKHVRDRGLDHAVEREKNLKPLLNIKNLIKSEPSKSIPLNIITQSKDSLQIPSRPIELIRKYPSIFQEFFPASINIHPHIKLTPEILSLDSDEDLFYQSVSYKEDVADRLLKLLMIGKINKIPLHVIDKLKWDLGLCNDYVETIVPEYPDYFQVNNESMLELVCWSHELAVSFLEKQAMKCESEDLLVKFDLKYSNGFEMDKKYKKWVDEWKKLPYISPYENVKNLPAKNDEADKWAVIILHEILSLCVGKKAEKDNLLLIGEYLGLRSRFKRALLLHPGIFYVSSKIDTHTVVLKEGYKRGMLIQKNSLMELRYKYVYLMNKVMEDKKSKDMQQKGSHDLKEGDAKETDVDMEDEEEEDDDEDSDDVHNDYHDDETDNETRDVKPSQRLNLRTRIDDRNSMTRDDDRRPSQRLNSRTRDDDRRPSQRLNSRTRDDDRRPSQRLYSRTRDYDRKTSAISPRTSSGRNRNRDVERPSRRSSWREENNGEQDAGTRYEDRKLPINSLKTSAGRSSNRDVERTSRRSSWRAENNSEQDARTRYEDRKLPINSLKTSAGRSSNRDVERPSRRSSWREENNGEQDAGTRYEDRKLPINSLKTSAGRSSNRDVERTSRRSSWRAENNSEQDARTRYEDRKLPINSLKTSAGRSSNRTNERTSRSSRRPETNDKQYAHRRSSNKFDLRRNRGTSEQRRNSTP
ncbi:protein WHAT'S THIS FACTOR 1 homolog, chloroplastic-like [Solanum dulcamara]|uniref:protein WHAT'S THIS FACTOR 1 homolog, chloroplastic-like n=1 Tax=Solanum dulcamara TaxID=45834 RepID=UPI0024865534|nr:protein WHAT'S THIS FACTOR 1 homolog, chloroplastic-like [Solanum dulcamara]